MREWPGTSARNSFKRALLDCERQIGLWSGLCSNIAAEIIAGAGFDWIVVDGEDAPNDIATLLAQLQAMRGGTAEPVFRIPWNDSVVIKRVLDIGARSLIIPFIQSAEEARMAVAATRYPPLGIRGVSVAPRANDYGRIRNYHQNAHLEICVLVQLESRVALKEVEAIAAVDGVNGIFIGPSDLAADFGHLGNPMHIEVQVAIKETADRIRATGKSAGTLATDVDDADRLFGLGFNFIAVGSDVGILARGAERLAERFRTNQDETNKAYTPVGRSFSFPP
jgi:4-hydroxy-2-oxoheptanedioate aldolase